MQRRPITPNPIDKPTMNVCPVIEGRYVRFFKGNTLITEARTREGECGKPVPYVSGNTIVLQYPNGSRDEYRFDEDGFCIGSTLY